MTSGGDTGAGQGIVVDDVTARRTEKVMQLNDGNELPSVGLGTYPLKDEAAVQAVAAVAEGKSFFSPAIARLMLDDYVKQRTGEPGVIDRYESLSDREREVFQLIAEGKANKDIAAILFISPSTVETHRARIMEKLDVHSAAEIVLYAVRRGVIR